MNYKYRVTLEGLKGFLRVYVVNGSNSLYTFHKQLRADLEFPVDQPILFKGFDASDAVVARYALIDLGDGTVDNVTIAKTVAAGITKFIYFYDVKSKKYVIVSFDGETDEEAALPTIIETKGPLPIDFERGYVAFEDLPVEKRKLPGEGGDEEDDDDDVADSEEEDINDEEEGIEDEDER